MILPLGDRLFFTREGVGFAKGATGNNGEGVMGLLDHLRVLQGKQLLATAFFAAAASIHPSQHAVEELLNGGGELRHGAWFGSHAY